MILGHDKGHNLPIQEALTKALEYFQAGRLLDSTTLCRKVLLAVPNSDDALRLLKEICQRLDIKVRSAVENFQRAPNPSTHVALRSIRREIIFFLEQQSIESLAFLWVSPLRDAHTVLMRSGLRDYIRNTEEDAMLKGLHATLSVTGCDPVRPVPLLEAMLLSHSYELPLPYNLLTTPEWLRESYVEFLLERPRVHNHVGNAEAYINYLYRLVELFHKIGLNEHGIVDDPAAQHLTCLFAVRGIFTQAYFNTDNLRNLYAQRSDLITAALIITGFKTLTVIPPHIHSKGKIRIGIYAGHFSPQTETYFTISHFEALDRLRFDITLYAEKTIGHPLEQQCIAHSDHFVVLPQEDIGKKVQRIRADDLDILIISTNMTAVANTGTLLGAFRMARIQIATLCSPVTTGGRHMDVMLSAQWNEPEESAAEHYTEHLYLLPGSANYYAYQYDTDKSTVVTKRSDLGISDEQIVFFSGANYYKILPELSLVWVKILASVPNSVLILMPYNPNWSNQYQSPPFIERIHHQMSELGVDTRRLQVIGSVLTRADVHKVLALADIYLDAYPFSGACSTLDSIIVGVPAVIRRGPVTRSIHSTSLMRMIGLEELITDSEEQYIAAAIATAKNQEKRQHIRNHLNKLKSLKPPPYFDIGLFSTRVGMALNKLHEQYLTHYHGLENMDRTIFRKNLQNLADSVVGNNFELNTLSDIGLVHALIAPYFRIHHVGYPLHMVDVGACYGQMAEPFLTTGWSADLFEPDPDARQILEKNMIPFGSKCRIFAAAVSNETIKEVCFHKSKQHGLSGLGDSPFGVTESIIKVPNVRLTEFYRQQGVKAVDFLKIDAEGYDFDVLESHDLSYLQPRLIMVEYGIQFTRQTLGSINQVIARMADSGYGAISFNYTDDGNFVKSRWIYRLLNIFVDCPIPEKHPYFFGNIIFYQTRDKDFLLTLYALLDTCRPRYRLWLEN